MADSDNFQNSSENIEKKLVSKGTKTKQSVFSCLNILVILYTVVVAVAVGVLMKTSQEFEVSMKQKQSKLASLEADLIQVKVTHKDSIKKCENEKSQHLINIEKLKEGKRHLGLAVREHESNKKDMDNSIKHYQENIRQ